MSKAHISPVVTISEKEKCSNARIDKQYVREKEKCSNKRIDKPYVREKWTNKGTDKQ